MQTRAEGGDEDTIDLPPDRGFETVLQDIVDYVVNCDCEVVRAHMCM